jgi:hypothetical protein
MPQDREIRVAVVGGGISGLTAALRLSQCGYKVTVYEEKPFLGGNVGSHDHNGDGIYHDVYPHLFSNFYVNFWDLAQKDLGLRRDLSPQSDFAPRESVKALRPQQRSYMELKDAGSPAALYANLFSGIAPPLHMYLWSYSMLDMLTRAFPSETLLGDYSVSGFVQSRPYATDAVIELHDLVLIVIWSVHAADTSASSYRNFLLQTFGNLSPLLWLLKGSLQEKIIGPLEEKLLQLGCEIRKNAIVTQVLVDGGRVSGIKLRQTSFDAHKHEPIIPGGPDRAGEQFDYLVLAVPPKALSDILMNAAVPMGHRIVDDVPQLAEMRRLNSEPIAVLDLYFKRKLEDIPRENVFLLDSACDLTYIDLSQLWDTPAMKGITALTVAVSDYDALPSDHAEDNKHALVLMLNQYLPQFNPGSHWGDENSDIDWDRSHYTASKADKLFINQVGSGAWRPQTHYPAIRNLFFAGDLCLNKIDMATVEAAVTSGLNAAIAIQRQEPRGKPIEMRHLPTYPEPAIIAMKMLMAPSAYAAKWWVTAADSLASMVQGNPRNDWSTQVGSMFGLPYAYANDWFKTAGALWASVFAGKRG